MEYCEGGDINQLIKRLKKASEYIQEDVIWKILTQIILAIHACHNRIEGKVLHRDIKPSNIFLDNENNIKLGDFGLSRVLSNESNFAYSHVGTPYYMSPEQIDEMRYNDKSDIWSLGCFLYELTTLNPPFEAKNHVSLALKIKAGKVDKINSKYSEDLWNVITWMLSVDHHFRPSIDELLNLPQISIRLKERKIKDFSSKLKQIEERLKIKEDVLNSKELELNKREKSIKEKEEALNEREKALNAMNDDYNSKMKLMESLSINQNAKSTSHNSSIKQNNNNSNQINANNGNSEEEYDTNASNKYIEDNNAYNPKSVFNSIQNLDYYLPNSNMNTISKSNRNVCLNKVSYDILNNANTYTNTNSFRFDPSLYNDNENASNKGIARYHSNNNVNNINKSNSSKRLIVDYYAKDNCTTNDKEIKGKKVIAGKRPSTPKNLHIANTIYQQQHISNSNINNNIQNKRYLTNKKRTNSVNSIIDNSNSISSNYIKARPINIPKNN